MSVDVFGAAALEAVQLFLEILGRIIHLDLQVVVLFAIYFEGNHEAKRFLRTKSVHYSRHQRLLVTLIRCLCLLAALRLGYTIESGFDSQLLHREGRDLVLNGEENLEVLAHADLAEGGVEVDD